MVDWLSDLIFYLTDGQSLQSVQWHVFFLLTSSLVIWTSFWILFFMKSDKTLTAGIICGILFFVWSFLILEVEQHQFYLMNDCQETVAYAQTEDTGRINLLITECRRKDRVGAEFVEWDPYAVRILRNQHSSY